MKTPLNQENINELKVSQPVCIVTMWENRSKTLQPWQKLTTSQEELEKNTTAQS